MIRSAAVLVLAVAFAAPTAAGDAAWIFAGNGLNAGTTLWGRAQGARELNPLLQDRGALVAWELGMAAGTTLACRELRRRDHPRAAKWFSRVGFALNVVVAAHNVRQGVLARQRRGQ